MIRKLIVTAALVLAAPVAAHAADCSVDLEGNDAMKFNKSAIEVPKSCKDFTINLKHTGKMARNVMGHNVVVSATSDMSGVNSDGVKAGLPNDYIKPDDARVIAHSKVIGGGETTSVKIPVAKLGAGPYSFFCSFPGHAALMKGTLTVK
ncbi:MAG: azurin [Xanthomonadales bacterium]|nr:azurin [Xanthomonadaceae bacterium]MBN8223742.1 azurin [Xanthomonadales bacterium]MCA0198158.1 azurin [Pseudomonadota bacterium]HRF83364.1 azurin [Pseudoxanthomonas sp.]